MDVGRGLELPIASSVTYKFSQRFDVPARDAYKWCTDYEPNDLALMKEKGQRKIQRITDDTIVLTEVIYQNVRKIKKTKLVKLNPNRLSWHNIQISGPNRYSEFLYEIVPENRRRSKLNFTGLLVVYGTKPSSKRLKHIANVERQYDSNTWKLLAKAMAKDH
jgi:hypothetical protein